MINMKVPKISLAFVYLMAAVGISPVLAAIWFAMHIPTQDSQGEYFLWLLTIILLFISCMLIPIAIRISSIKISIEGIQQISFFSNGRLWSNQEIKWKDVERVMLRGLTYTLFSENKSIVISLASFRNYKDAGAFVDHQIPESAERLHS